MRKGIHRFACTALIYALLFVGTACAETTHTLVVSGNGGVSDDPAFPTSWDAFAPTVFSCLIDGDFPDVVYTSSNGFSFFYGTFPVWRAGLLYFDVSGIPVGTRVVRATLHAKTWWAGFSPDPARPDSLLACADTSASDARWVGANQATYNEPRQGMTGPWIPALSARATYRQFGIVSKPQTAPLPSGMDKPSGGWFSLDVTRGIQAWVNGKPNAGMWLFGRAWFNKNMSIYWSQAADAALRPWLEIVWEDVPYRGPWADGKEVAFTFSTDDGYCDNMIWASVLDSLDAKFTVCVIDSCVQIGNQGVANWLDDADLASLVARGHEVASHSRTHRRWDPDVVPDSIVVWELERACIQQHVGDAQQIVSLAWPYHLHNARMCEIARQSGYIVGRNGGIDYSPSQRGRLCNWDSCRVYEVGLTCYTQRIVGDEEATRLYVRNCITEGIEHGNAWINLFAHTIDGRYDGVDLTRQELIWTIDELQRSGVVWIETMGHVAQYYRQFHTPSVNDPLLLVLNNPPVAVADAAFSDQGAAVAIDVLSNDYDSDGVIDPSSVDIVAGPEHGVISIDYETGAVIYTPTSGFAGTDTIYYTVRDDDGASSSPATIAITATSSATDVPMPNWLRLGQNFPNPFNPSTRIEFELLSRQQVVLAIYAVNGRRVTTLLAKELPPGPHEVSWNGRDSRGMPVPSGAYIYQLRAGEIRQSKCMMLLQ